MVLSYRFVKSYGRPEGRRLERPDWEFCMHNYELRTTNRSRRCFVVPLRGGGTAVRTDCRTARLRGCRTPLGFGGVGLGTASPGCAVATLGFDVEPLRGWESPWPLDQRFVLLVLRKPFRVFRGHGGPPDFWPSFWQIICSVFHPCSIRGCGSPVVDVSRAKTTATKPIARTKSRWTRRLRRQSP